MTTTADIKLRECKEQIDEAISSLSEALNKNTYGNEDFDDDKIIELEKVWLDLRRIKREINYL